MFSVIYLIKYILFIQSLAANKNYLQSSFKKGKSQYIIKSNEKHSNENKSDKNHNMQIHLKTNRYVRNK